MINITITSLPQGSCNKGQLNGPEVCGEDMDKGTLIHGGWECKLERALWKTLWRLLKKLETGTHMTQQSYSPYLSEKKKKQPKNTNSKR